MVKKICVRVLSVVKWLLLIVLVALLISTLTHQIMTVVETQQNPPLGKMVSVDGKKMSIYITGSGAHTIVLMPGLGTASPILDFMPLTEELAESNRVVVVEPFGYGWSDVTTEERTVQNQVEELRNRREFLVPMC